MALPRKVAILPGDGIGKEVVAVGREILELYRTKAGFPLELWDLDLGADRYLRDGTTMPEDVFAEIRDNCGAVLLGALGDPRVPNLEHARDILLGMRFRLDLFANVRPCRALDDRLVPLKGKGAKDVDFVVFRENTEGIYVNVGGNFKKGTPDEIAVNEDINTRKGVERIIRAAFAWAQNHGKKTVHMADKSNAMRQSGDLWQRAFQEVARDYPASSAKHVYVDALCLFMVQAPERFEVIVTNNLFGDIITDLAAALHGGLGIACSASVHVTPDGTPRVGLFEPVHGSAPDIAGHDKANPLATVLTVGMLLEHLGFAGEERRLEQIVQAAVREKKCTADVGGTLGTKATGAFVLERLARELG
ncbi:MAG: isocitrate/isopropylmalate dehydrogenase family protein [Deltaproteobacteria bacterium]|nr:isocitrate/isopropylmalate dehydrogenase family protein [Deltaproteobacteria bacterium]